MNQSILAQDAGGNLMFEFPLWTMREFWKAAGRKNEDFPVPKDALEARELAILSGLLDREEEEVKVTLFTPKDWKPMPDDLELFQRDANGEYVREAPKEEEVWDCWYCGDQNSKNCWVCQGCGEDKEEGNHQGKAEEEASPQEKGKVCKRCGGKRGRWNDYQCACY